jgi:RNA polymerase sigma factor (sigma-70 family)
MAEEGCGREDGPDFARTARREFWLGLYQQYYEDLRRYLTRQVKCPHDVDDLLQAVFLNLIAHEGPVQNPHAYLFAVARHQVFCHWRWKRRRVLAAQILSSGGGPASAGVGSYDRESDPLRQAGRTETRAAVAAMVADLSPALRDAVRLRYVDGLGLPEAAARAGCSRVALKKRLERAKQFLATLCRPKGIGRAGQGRPNDTNLCPLAGRRGTSTMTTPAGSNA